MQDSFTARYVLGLAAAALIVLNAACAKAPGLESPVYRVSTDKPFEDVIFDLEFAISERNFRITGANKIGKGLRERGYENYPDFEVIHFCSLERAREILDIDPDFVAQMPCRIAVHEQGGKVIITAILLPSSHPDPRVNAFAREMNGLIRDIVAFGAEPF